MKIPTTVIIFPRIYTFKSLQVTCVFVNCITFEALLEVCHDHLRIRRSNANFSQESVWETFIQCWAIDAHEFISDE